MASLLSSVVSLAAAPQPWLEFSAGGSGGSTSAAPKRVVLISGDEEYRSEESMPMLAKILSQKHGFQCTVLFAVDPTTGIINPNFQKNIPGLEALARADVLIIATRFRQLPPEQLRIIADYLKAGKPVIGLRTATHAFTGDAETDGLKWKDFGLVVLGETWVNHHGKHKVEGTRALLEPSHANAAVLQGVKDIVVPTDVYGVTHLNAEARILLRGQVTSTLDPQAPAVEGAKNEPMMPLAWMRDYAIPGGKSGRAFCTTMGASIDLLSEDLRRLLVNVVCEFAGKPVPAHADVTVIDPYEPSFYGFVDAEAWVARGLKPEDFALGKTTRPFERVVVPAGFKAPSALLP